MSRRANPAADRAAQNQQTIKNILKLDCNKTCADCKRNKHPRWASWNLGVFVCIRCSGIHRGMGTHISRVKSVDLDAWTDEQLQSVLKWGNGRANKYWESKLAAGHVPSEAKMENFIRTKYEAKRWIMDGPMPDPASLDSEGDDNVPLAVVQEKVKMERSSSQRASSAAAQPPTRQQQPTIDLFADDTPAPPVRPSTTDLSGPRAQASTVQSPPAPPTAPPKQTKPGDSLLGLDFFGPEQPAPTNRPSSTASNPSSTGPSRPDLKQSILSLYSSAPKPQSPPQHDRNTSFGSLSMQSPPPPSTQNDAFGGLTDAFSGLSFPSTTGASASKPSTTSAFDSLTSPKSPPAMPKTSSQPPSSGLSGGLLDSTPSQSQPKPQQSRTQSTSSGNNLDLIGATMGSMKSPPAPPSTSNTTMDPFSPPPPNVSPPAPAQQPDINSAFNLSSPQQQAPKSPPVSTPAVTSMLSTNTIDPWGGDAWAAPEPTPPTKQPSPMMKVPDKLTPNDMGGGWGMSGSSAKATPTVSADEDFGGWTSPTQSNNNQPVGASKPAGGFAGSDDLFSNVWQ